jgi:alcohol dehydrogenase class IV
MWRFLVPHIKFGKSSLEYLKDLDGKKALIVTDETLRKLGFADKVINYLKEALIKSRIFDGVKPDPSTLEVEKGVKMVREFQPDWIIGLGGGSSMDTAKAIWILYERPDLSIKDLKDPTLHLGLRKKARFLAIPTTSGTGADCTWAIVITDPKEHKKMECAFDEVIADVAIVDPEFVLRMPKQITADTGLDALCHAIEAYVSIWKNDFTDGFAIKAMQLVFEYLPKAYKSGEKDEVAREHMHNAASMAGIAFGDSQAGFAHSMGHSLGAVFRIPHGRAVGIALPYVIQYNSKEVCNLYAEIAKIIGLKGLSEKELTSKLVDKLKSLMKEIEEPLNIKNLGIKKKDFEEKFEELVDKAVGDQCTPMNPRKVSKEDCQNLFKYAYEGKDIDF